MISLKPSDRGWNGSSTCCASCARAARRAPGCVRCTRVPRSRAGRVAFPESHQDLLADTRHRHHSVGDAGWPWLTRIQHELRSSSWPSDPSGTAPARGPLRRCRFLARRADHDGALHAADRGRDVRNSGRCACLVKTASPATFHSPVAVPSRRVPNTNKVSLVPRSGCGCPSTPKTTPGQRLRTLESNVTRRLARRRLCKWRSARNLPASTSWKRRARNGSARSGPRARSRDPPVRRAGNRACRSRSLEWRSARAAH